MILLWMKINKNLKVNFVNNIIQNSKFLWFFQLFVFISTFNEQIQKLSQTSNTICDVW